MSRALFLVLLAAVGLARLLEMRLSRRHARELAARGARPARDPAFAAMVALHAGVLVGAALEVVRLHRPFRAAIGVPALVLLALANALRAWVIVTLGRHWNVRVIGSLALGVVTGGPYRFVRHPNYLAVFVELLALPLVHGAWLTAVAGAALHVVVLARRLAAEEPLLAADPAYREAMARKPRFIPWPLPLPRLGRPTWPTS